MSIERSLLARARPFMLAAKARSLVRSEVSKGCRPVISRESVALEPLFQPIQDPRPLLAGDVTSDAIPERPESAERLVRCRAWIPSDYTAEWRRSERFLKQLVSVTHRVAFEIVGNETHVTMGLLCHERDLPEIGTAFYAEFARCELVPDRQDPFHDLSAPAWANAVFADYLPPPPYSDLLTRLDELYATPFESLITAMARIPSGAIGICQVLFQPVSPEHDWHHNVEVILDLEYMVKMLDGVSLPQRYAQQAPSGDLRQMAWQVESKAHNDKPFFAAALRLAVVGSNGAGPVQLRSLSTFSHLFQHGGRPLNRLTQEDYAAFLDGQRIRDMFAQGLTYRPGFLVNSWELAGLVHLPPASILDHRRIPLETLDPLPPPSEELSSGTRVGTCTHAGRTIPVYIPDELRKRHTHIIGRPTMGKTLLMERMILNDLAAGAGVAVIDPHGDLVKRLLVMIPARDIERTIYFDPGDPDWVPIWNPLQSIPGQDIGRAADVLVTAFKRFVTGWGDRLERLLHEVFYALLHLPGSTLLDASNALQKSVESERLRKEILQVVDGEEPRQFWSNDFKLYRKDDLGPPKNKLSKLLIGQRVPLMLSQPDSAFNFRQIMDDGMILLVDLSTIGPGVSGVLGCLMLSLIQLAALSRSDTPVDKRRQYHLFCDEGHRFMTDALEDLILETRKYGVSLTIAHQTLSQFGQRSSDALSSTGSTIIFSVDRKGAGQLTKDLRGLVSTDDLINLEQFKAVLRAGTTVTHIDTPGFRRITGHGHRDRIIAESRRRYYKPAAEVRKAIRQRGERRGGVVIPLTAHTEGAPTEELAYDEL